MTPPPPPPLNRIILYTRRMDEMIAFYTRPFGFQARRDPDDRIVTLAQPGGGTQLLLHPAAKSAREGQTAVKLVFDVADVPAFCAAAAKAGLMFGPLHAGDGYVFANAKDPAQNSISVSGRAVAR